MKVRCDKRDTCGATDKEAASNWCEHYGNHEAGKTEDPCETICYALGPVGVIVKCTAKRRRGK